MLVCAAVPGGAINNALDNVWLLSLEIDGVIYSIIWYFTETRSKTHAILLDIELADLLATEEAEWQQRLEEGYESENHGNESEIKE